MSIKTAQFSNALRSKAIDVEKRRLLITNFRGSEQEGDLSEPCNCEGYGRIRHFRRVGSPGWPENPLPIDPACHKLNLGALDRLNAQIFQNAACNWRCWYCFVPFNLLNASAKHSAWLGAAEIVDLYQKETDPPRIIDLSGGQPDLTPEWIPWMMRELEMRNLHERTYLWSDDNLSNDYFWRYLSSDDIEVIRRYENYGKVCCFKGFNKNSFAFNTGAEPDLFEQQFALFAQYLKLGIDLYAYATFTTKEDVNVEGEMRRFVDQLQEVSVNLPLRVVPLEIQTFGPVQERMGKEHVAALKIQWEAVQAWKNEIERRFPSAIRSQPIYAIEL